MGSAPKEHTTTGGGDEWLIFSMQNSAGESCCPLLSKKRKKAVFGHKKHLQIWLRTKIQPAAKTTLTEAQGKGTYPHFETP